MKFSIIIPARNEEKYLAETLQSIEEQDYPDYETIVVANDCTDNTAEIAKKYADKVLIVGEAGVSKARNLGAEKASGNVLIFLDADTKLSQGVLQNILAEFSGDYSVGTIKIKPHALKLKYKAMMGFKNLVNKAGVYPWMAGMVYCRKENFAGFDNNLQIKETIHFMRKMMKKGRFQYLDGSYAITSMRRYENWGSFGLILFFVKKWFKSFFSDIKGDKYPVVR